jgi:protein-disulfide isomerase
MVNEMPRGSKRTVALLACAALLAAVSGGSRTVDAGDIPWDKVLGAKPDELDKDQKAEAAAILEKEKVYHGCKNTIAKCLRSDPDSLTARRLAGMVVRKVKAGYGKDQIHEMIKKRGLSMHPIKTHSISLAGAASIGDDDPEVKVVAFSDFQCPFCRKVLPRLEKLAKKMDGVRLYFKHFPVKSHKRSVPAAVASLAAHKQGKFWPFHDICYKDSKNLSDSDLLKKAKDAGVEDMDKFKKDLKSKSLLKIVEKDKLEGLKLGVKGTPTVFIDGKKYSGETTYSDLKDVLNEELDLVAGKK